ncbi:hypothetical protein A5906_36910 [Bradyrhizobium sacchari]|uniref:Uncharacterized protein n=1 Tax=Bradyrhizobium sacchari TaxID=1399419 RepID=A0A560JJG4_9BRAD|nr:hypothetical protein [Bradyrhizobium sacchari]OPY97832.1 hypothetical protein A5906_36910 [Bradyrhizobium sacchari]TWB57061.1 hypothetical protein FBZ94_106320 [Bradyrhizobium sacchari]TWB71338.1 hypothetical protein FBZ95_107320 [Bradyrhizobium sacchari]
MSTLLFALMRENPLPGLAAASLNVMVALCLVALSLLLGITIAMIACAHTLATRQTSTVRLDGRTVA